MKAASPGRFGPVWACLVNGWDESSGKVLAKYWELREKIPGGGKLQK